MREIEKDVTLKTEFIVEGKIDSIYEIVDETVSANHFNLVPFRFSDNTSTRKSYQVMIIDRRTQMKYPCGAIELIKQKENDQVLFRLDSTKGTAGSSKHQGSAPLERVFYLILQQLLQRGIQFSRVHKREHSL